MGYLLAIYSARGGSRKRPGLKLTSGPWTVPVGAMLVFLLLASKPVQATTYYLDASGGNDQNAGIAPTLPWKTLAKINAQKLHPGDSVLLKRGEIWREQLTILSGGAPGNPITIGSYGDGEVKPIISGANIINPALWTHYRGNIYVANVGSITPPNQLYVDGVYQELARYPKNSYLLTTAESSEANVVVDSTLRLTGQQIVGSTIVARSASWASTAAPVTTYDANTHSISLGANTRYKMPKGYGYYFRNMLWMLNDPKEWIYDAAAGKVYLWLAGGDNPANHLVEMSARDYGLHVGGTGFVDIRDLTLAYAINRNLYISYLPLHDITVEDVDMVGSRIGAILYANNVKFRNNAIRDALDQGLLAGGTNVTIFNNVIDHTGSVARAPDTDGTGIMADKIATGVIGNNFVMNSGLIGISARGSNITVSNNTIEHSCLFLDDCAGIYMTFYGEPADLPYIGNRIIGNIIKNSIGNYSGTAYNHTQAEGVYLDDLSHDVVVQNNTTFNVDHGLFLHNGANHTATGNRFYSSRMAGLWIKEEKGSSVGFVRGNLIQGNVFESLATANGAALYRNSLETTANFGTYNNNLYCHPNSVAAVTESTMSGVSNFSLTAWQAFSRQDLQSADQQAACPEANPPPFRPAVKFSAAPTAVP